MVGTTGTIKNSSYNVMNDTWNYFVFEWNSTGNLLEINQEKIFDGDVARTTYTECVVEQPLGNMSFYTDTWRVFGFKSAVMYFTHLIDSETFTLFPTINARTMFMMKSTPSVTYTTQYDETGSTWNSSFGLIDNLNFEYDTSMKHDYLPAKMFIDDTSSNFTIHSLLTRSYDVNAWPDIDLYDGASYNVSFTANASWDSYPLQITCDDTEYISFVGTSTKTVSIIHPIDVNTRKFTVKIMSSNGTYTIQDFKVTLTSQVPYVIDSFKKYMHDNSIFSYYLSIGASIATNITNGTYYLMAEEVPSTDIAYFDTFNVTKNYSNDVIILPPSLRDITVAYNDQRGIPIGNIRTYLRVGETFQLQPSNILQAEIGTTITIMSKNVFDEIVYYGSYKVRSFSNYIGIIVIVHSMMI
jgi:hypothetical protein